MKDILYALEPDLSVDAFQDILKRSTLAERRPQEAERLVIMLKKADILLTARQDGFLVGLSRAITDFSCCYLSDLAVDVAFQKRGIGKRLIGGRIQPQD